MLFQTAVKPGEELIVNKNLESISFVFVPINPFSTIEVDGVTVLVCGEKGKHIEQIFKQIFIVMTQVDEVVLYVHSSLIYLHR